MCSDIGAYKDMMTTPLPLLLASASPRRRQIFQLLGLPYTVCTPPVDEDTAQKRFRGLAEELAPWIKSVHMVFSTQTFNQPAILMDVISMLLVFPCVCWLIYWLILMCIPY